MKKIPIIIFGLLCLIISSCSDNLSTEVGGVSSKNGSYTRMLIVKNRLYGVSNTDISTLDISDKKNPKVLNVKNLGFGVESIFHHEGLLLIGSSQRMYIMKLDANGVPVLESQANYFDDFVDACDPIVAKNSTAYVTLSPNTATLISTCSSTRIGRALTIGELRSYDISNIKSPVLKSSLEISNPKGLAIDGDFLFVCNSQKGINVYSTAKNSFIPELLYTSDPFDAYDVIVNKGIITVVGGKNLHQYILENASGKISLRKLSTIDL